MGIIIKPIVTEKLTAQGDKLNRYGFVVDRKANKLQIKEAVETLYGVSVADVNTINYHGKRKQRYTKAGLQVRIRLIFTLTSRREVQWQSENSNR